MKNLYKKPEIVITSFKSEDIMAGTSGFTRVAGSQTEFQRVTTYGTLK